MTDAMTQRCNEGRNEGYALKDATNDGMKAAMK